VGDDSKARQLRKFSRLHKTKHPTTRTSKEMAINLSGRTLDEGTQSLLQKGLNYAVTPRVTPIEDILALPVEMAEETTQETVRLIKSPAEQRDNLKKI
jgi:hypothetical protein